MTEAGGSRSEGYGGAAPCPASSGSASGPSAPKQRDDCEAELESVRRGIAEIGPKISRLEEEMKEAQNRGDTDEVKELRTDLRQLREQKNLLLQVKLKLMDQRGAAEGQCASLRACTDASGRRPECYVDVPSGERMRN
jgi:septal ring factor EnvC (AmiA/AmiB activator)